MNETVMKRAKLKDNELCLVNGGSGAEDTSKSVYCSYCGEHFKLTTDKKVIICPQCGKDLSQTGSGGTIHGS